MRSKSEIMGPLTLLFFSQASGGELAFGELVFTENIRPHQAAITRKTSAFRYAHVVEGEHVNCFLQEATEIYDASDVCEHSSV